MPAVLDPAVWLGFVGHLSRPSAALVLVVSASMLVLGLRGFRYYVCLGAAVALGLGGVMLAKLMYVSPWYVALPAAALGGGIAWPLARGLTPLLIGFVLACAFGLGVERGLELGRYYWAGFGAGATVGIIAARLAPHFSLALVCAAFGTFGVMTTLGAVVRQPSGPFAVGGYLAHPMGFVIAGAVMFVAAIVLMAIAAGSDDDFVDELS